MRVKAGAVVTARGCVIVSCPRSNRWVGAGDPPIDAFYASGALVAFGTDSLASADSLDMFAELAAARRISSVADATLLAAAGSAADAGSDEPSDESDEAQSDAGKGEAPRQFKRGAPKLRFD